MGRDMHQHTNIGRTDFDVCFTHNSWSREWIDYFPLGHDDQHILTFNSRLPVQTVATKIIVSTLGEKDAMLPVIQWDDCINVLNAPITILYFGTAPQ